MKARTPSQTSQQSDEDHNPLIDKYLQMFKAEPGVFTTEQLGRADSHLSYLYYIQGDYDSAISSYESALHAIPDDMKLDSAIHEYAGRAAFKLMYLEFSIECYERALAISPLNPRTAKELERVKLCKKICEENNYLQSPDYYHREMGKTYLDMDFLDEATESFSRLKVDIEVRYYLGLIAFKKREYALAIEYLSQATEMIQQPDPLISIYDLKWQEKIAVRDKKNKLTTPVSDLLTQVKQHQIATVRQELQNAMCNTQAETKQADPDAPLAPSAEESLKAGISCLKYGKPDAAQKHFQLALASNKTWPEANYYLGNAAHLRGDYHVALSHYDNAITARPDDAKYHHAAGLALFKLNKLQEASGRFTKASKLCSAVPVQYIRNRAAALYALGGVKRLTDAVNLYGQIVRHEPESAAAVYNLALAQQKLSQVATIEEEAKKAKSAAINCFNHVLGKSLKQSSLAIELHTCLRLKELKPDEYRLPILDYLKEFYRLPRESLTAVDLLVCFIALNQIKQLEFAKETAKEFFRRYKFDDIPHYLREEFTSATATVWKLNCMSEVKADELTNKPSHEMTAEIDFKIYLAARVKSEVATSRKESLSHIIANNETPLVAREEESKSSFAQRVKAEGTGLRKNSSAVLFKPVDAQQQGSNSLDQRHSTPDLYASQERKSQSFTTPSNFR